MRCSFLIFLSTSRGVTHNFFYHFGKDLQFHLLMLLHWSRVISVSIVSNYGLDDRAIGVRSPVGPNDFSSSLCVQTGSGAHPASCTVGTVGPFPGGKSAAGA
jgi:hypothetical protein